MSTFLWEVLWLLTRCITFTPWARKVPGSVPVIPGIWWGGEIDALRNLIATGTVGRDQVRFFLGYSGWEKGQLKRELSENSWIIAKVPPEGDHEEPRQRMARRTEVTQQQIPYLG
jgi:putative AlgH/UPF0301 family transcriptional regulator